MLKMKLQRKIEQDALLKLLKLRSNWIVKNLHSPYLTINKKIICKSLNLT